MNKNRSFESIEHDNYLIKWVFEEKKVTAKQHECTVD